MKNTIAIILGASLLLAGGHAAQAQRTADRTANGGNYQRGNTAYTRNTRGIASYGADPRTATNVGVEIITINNIFNPTRAYRVPTTNGPAPIPTYTFTLTGVMTYGVNDVGYGFFSGNAVSPTRAYTTSDTINGYKVSAITNNTVKLVDTNNQEFTLRVGAGFTRRGTTNAWRFLSVPEPSLSPAGATMSPDSDSGPTGPMSDVMKKLMARRAAEEGPAAGGDVAAPDAGAAPAPDGAAPPAPPDGGPPPAADGAAPPPPPADGGTPPAPPAN